MVCIRLLANVIKSLMFAHLIPSVTNTTKISNLHNWTFSSLIKCKFHIHKSFNTDHIHLANGKEVASSSCLIFNTKLNYFSCTEKSMARYYTTFDTAITRNIWAFIYNMITLSSLSCTDWCDLFYLTPWRSSL